MLRRFGSTIRAVSAGGFDPDALNYLTVSGNLGDATIEAAINDLVLGLKADSLWSSIVALYPFAGGTDVKHSYNLKDPALHQITWNGAVTHNANGIQSAGGYGDTNVSGTEITDEGSSSIYIRDNVLSNLFDYGHAKSSAPNSRFYFSANRSVTPGNAFVGCFTTSTSVTTPNADTLGSHYMARNAVGVSDVIFRKNNLPEAIVLSGITNTGSIPINIFICCQNNNGTPSGTTTRNYASFALFNQYLPNADVFHDRIQAYQTALSRQV